MSSYEEPPSPVSVASSEAQRRQKEKGVDHGENHGRELPLLTQQFMPCDPAKWNVEDVYAFICSLTGRVWHSKCWVSVWTGTLLGVSDQQKFTNLLNFIHLSRGHKSLAQTMPCTVPKHDCAPSLACAHITLNIPGLCTLTSLWCDFFFFFFVKKKSALARHNGVHHHNVIDLKTYLFILAFAWLLVCMLEYTSLVVFFFFM